MHKRYRCEAELPLTLLEAIMGFLYEEDLARVRKVCRAWRRVRAGWCKFNRWNLSDQFFVQRARSCIPANVHTIDLFSSSLLSSGALSLLACFGNLQVINLACCSQVDDACLLALSTCTSIQELSLSRCTLITDFGLKHITALVSLVELNLSFCSNITDAGLVHVASFPHLRRLNFEHCNLITDAGLVHIAQMTTLEHIVLWTYSKVLLDLAHFASVSQSPRLEFANPSSRGMGYHFKGHSRLQQLGLHPYYDYQTWDSFFPY